MTIRRTSRQRYREFVDDYRQKRLDAIADRHNQQPVTPDEQTGKGLFRGKRSAYIRDYMAWLRPHRATLALVFTLALIVAGLQMVEPLFMRYIVDQVLLNQQLDATSRMARLNVVGGAFLVVIIVTNLLKILKDYRQRLLNANLMLGMRRSLYDKMLSLPLPRLWGMKAGGILSRLTGDVDTTTGLLQMAIISPSLSIIRLIIAISILSVLNWRLALMAMAVIPAAMFISFASAKRIRPIYRVVRRDVEHIDGRVGEVFSGVRVVRAFAREARERLDYMRGRHTVLRKELFAHRRELLLWTSWGLVTAAINVVIIWFGGYLNVVGRASIGDIMAFQWYTFLLMDPVWNIVNSFSELQRSLAAMDRVFDVLKAESDKPDRPDAVDAPPVVHELRF